MSERQTGPYDSLARRWLALAERRQAHFIELCNSGRWKHYFTQDQLDDEMRRVNDAYERWAEIVGVAPQAGEPDRAQPSGSVAA